MLRMLRLVVVSVLLCCYEHLDLIMCSIAGALCKWSCRNQGKCCNQSQVPQPSCGTWWWRSWLRICIFRPIPTCNSPTDIFLFHSQYFAKNVSIYEFFSGKTKLIGNLLHEQHLQIPRLSGGGDVSAELVLHICFTTFATLCITLQIACFEDTIQYEQQSST